MQRGLGKVSNESLVWGEFEKEYGQFVTKGLGAYTGIIWPRHPHWGVDPTSDLYQHARRSWHQNLGELFGFHGTCHVGDTGATSGTALRLTVSLSHTDLSRLVEVQAVAGGRAKQNPHQTRLFTYEVRDAAALDVLRAARLFVDADNALAFELIDAAVSFRRSVPGRGKKIDEQALASQRYWKEQLDRLGAFQRNQPVPFHNCLDERARAGSGAPRRT